MPHGWAISELWLLMRDCLVFEDDNQRLVLLAGIPPEWLRHPDGIEIDGLGTYFGTCGLAWNTRENGAVLKLSGTSTPPNGFVLRLPPSLNAALVLDGQHTMALPNGDCILPKDVKEVYIQFQN